MDKLFTVVDRWLAIKDRECIKIVLCVVIHAAMPGDPLWLLIVGAPGATKTELARSLTKVKHRGQDFVYPVDTLGPHTLVSGLVVEGGSDPSLLPLINDKLLVIKDLSDIVSHSWNDQKAVYADLRQAYDGYLQKPFGSGAGRRGGRSHFGILACATSVIDNFNVLTQQLGERFLRVRPQIDEDAAVDKANEVAGWEETMREELRSAFCDTLEPLLATLNVDAILAVPPDPRIIPLAKLVAAMRSEVERDRNRMVKRRPEREVGTRLVKQLTALYRMATHVGVADGYALVRRVARDSIPSYRLDIMRAIQGADWWTIDEISTLADIPYNTCRERLEDMSLLGVLEASGSGTRGNPYEYRVSDRYTKMLGEAQLL